MGCKKSIICGDSVVDYGEDCEPSYYGPYQSDICADGTVRYKSCGSDCKWPD